MRFKAPNRQRGQFSFGPFAVFQIPLALKGIKDATRQGLPQSLSVLGTGFQALRKLLTVKAEQPSLSDSEVKRIAEERELALLVSAFPVVAPVVTPALPQFSEPVVTANVPITVTDVLPPPVEPPDTTVETKEEPAVSNGFELIPFLSGVANVFGAASELGSVIRGPVAAPAPVQIQPVQAAAGVLPAIRAGAIGAGAMATGFLGFGSGNGTPLSRARDSQGRRPSRRRVITAARICGLEVAAQSFGLSITELCEIVSKGMPRRSRGISSADMRRTRSTLRKMSTMRKTLRPLCR